MKKLFPIIVAILALLSSCSKDDNSITITNLSGKNWYERKYGSDNQKRANYPAIRRLVWLK